MVVNFPKLSVGILFTINAGSTKFSIPFSFLRSTSIVSRRYVGTSWKQGKFDMVVMIKDRQELRLAIFKQKLLPIQLWWINKAPIWSLHNGAILFAERGKDFPCPCGNTAICSCESRYGTVQVWGTIQTSRTMAAQYQRICRLLPLDR